MVGGSKPRRFSFGRQGREGWEEELVTSSGNILSSSAGIIKILSPASSARPFVGRANTRGRAFVCVIGATDDEDGIDDGGGKAD